MPQAPPTSGVNGAVGTPTEYKTYGMRWVALVQLAVLTGGNAAQWIIFGIVVDQSKEYFGLDTVQVNMLTASYEMVFVVSGPFAMTLFDRYGVRAGLRTASFFNGVGCLLRFVAVWWFPNFMTIMLSQLVLAVAYVFTYPAPPILAARWFGDRERTKATTLAAISNAFGMALGQLIAPLIVTPGDHSEGRWTLLFAVTCVYSLFDAILVAFVVPFGPATPPSSAEEVKGPGRAAVMASNEPRCDDDNFSGYLSSSDDDDGEPRRNHNKHHPAPASVQSGAAPLLHNSSNVGAGGTRTPSSHNTSTRSSVSQRRISLVASEVLDRESVLQQLRVCLSRPGYRGLFFGMALFFGCQWSCLGLMAQIVKPMGISEATVGWMGFFQIVLGSLLAIPFSAWVDRIRAYKAPLTATLIACTTLYLVYAMVLTFEPPGMVPLAFAVYVLLGVPQACALPVMFEFAVELTYPVDESLSGMGIVWLANVVAIPMLFGVPAVIGTPPTRNGALVSVYALAVISSAATLLVGIPEEKLRRLQYERACREMQRGSSAMNDGSTVAELR
jgi:MFS family permease